MRKLFNDEAGFVISAELVLVLTIAVLAMAVGLTAVRDSITNELNDLAHAFGTVEQSYSVAGVKKNKNSGDHASIVGFKYIDGRDDCDCKLIAIDEVCGKADPSGSTNENSNN